MNRDLAKLYAVRFIQRRDVKAIQYATGAYTPDRSGFKMSDLLAHLDGSASYGHYLLDAESNCRMFAFDIDLRKTGTYLPMPVNYADLSAAEVNAEPIALGDPNDRNDNSLREAWANRAHPARPWLKSQMGALAHKFVNAIQTELELPCAAAYSGNKGIHVYGFTGPMPASDVRAAANLVISSMDDWELERGSHQWKHKITDPYLGYGNFSVEVFPKQDNLDGKDLGNLMRLPMGRNLKSSDPTFFMDLTAPVGVLKPHADPIKLLNEGNPYA